MKEFILGNLVLNQDIILLDIILNNAVTFVVAFFIMFTYRITYSGASYSKKFNVSLGMITIITTLIMSVISNNIALSLGMVGALSIIRFRTAVKDVRDAAFIFWGIAVGIGCGVSQFALVGMGSLTLFLFLILTRQITAENKQLMVVQCDLSSQNKVEAEVVDYFGKKARLTMKNASKSHCELVYSLTLRTLEKKQDKKMVDIVQTLMAVEGVTHVNLVEQLEDIGR